MRVIVHSENIYNEFASVKSKNQLELLDEWFQGLIIHEVPSDGNTKKSAEYFDHEFVIQTVKYHGYFYSGGSTRISQITGRLTGTVKGNQVQAERNG